MPGLNQILLAAEKLLTVPERVSVFRNLPVGLDWMRDRWFLLLGLTAVLFLLIALYFIRRNARISQQKVSRSLFDSNANRLGLDNHQRDLAWKIAEYAGIVNKEQLYLSSEIFNIGSSRLLNDCLKRGLSLDERKKENKKIHSLGEILGFSKSIPKVSFHSNISRKITSRHMSVGKTVTMVDCENDSLRIDAEILDNNEYELWLKPDASLKVEAGQKWRMFYHLGASVWEFNCYLIGVEDNKLVFGHSSHVKFINRRRFKRVAIRRHIWMARFDYSKDFVGMPEKQLPEFNPARVVEISGPGLKTISHENYKFNDRVLVMFEIKPGRLIQDVAEVRHVHKIEEGYVTALELVTVDERTTDELVRETNRLATESQLQYRELMEMSAKSV